MKRRLIELEPGMEIPENAILVAERLVPDINSTTEVLINSGWLFNTYERRTNYKKMFVYEVTYEVEE